MVNKKYEGLRNIFVVRTQALRTPSIKTFEIPHVFNPLYALVGGTRWQKVYTQRIWVLIFFFRPRFFPDFPVFSSQSSLESPGELVVDYWDSPEPCCFGSQRESLAELVGYLFYKYPVLIHSLMSFSLPFVSVLPKQLFLRFF